MGRPRKYPLEVPGEVIDTTPEPVDLNHQQLADQAEAARESHVPALGRAAMRNVHSSQVDKSKLTAPTLCADGWLVPNG